MKAEMQPVEPADSTTIDALLVGIWVLDEGHQVTELLFRSDGRYQRDTRSSDSDLQYLLTEQGTYQVLNDRLVLIPYEYFGEPQPKQLGFSRTDDVLTVSALEYEYTQVYVMRPGSRDDVMARESVEASLVGTWSRSLPYSGHEEYTFRPDGFYMRRSAPDETQFPPEYVWGRYEQDGARLTLKPYSFVHAQLQLDFFGDALTMIRQEEFSGDSLTYRLVEGSPEDLRTRTAEAEAFLARADWHVGTWEIRDAVHSVDLTLRPDGYYIAREHTEYLAGVVRGQYVLDSRHIHLRPFAGQDLYARSNGEFGKVERTRQLDYYDGELQFIDVEALSQSVTIARKRAGSVSDVAGKVRAARAEREQPDWHLGVWEVNDPAGWMEFTFRPDGRYIAKAGIDAVPREVERGEYLSASDTVTLAPYPGLGSARAFGVDLYDGELFLIGDPHRLVVARKVPGSERPVIDQTVAPQAMQGERGSILGLWTADLPGESASLVFRPDGEFRLNRCSENVASEDYGLFTVDMVSRTLVYDSRFVEQQNCGLDFYGSTMTIYGATFGRPRTYAVNLGAADAAIERSHAADGAAALVDAEWARRTPLGPRDSHAGQTPTADIPADPQPGRVFEAATVFTGFHLYRRFIPGFVYFNVQGTIRAVPVMNSREFYVFPTGRILIRFRNYRATFTYPTTIADTSDSWGAYRVEPKPEHQDVLHRYAENVMVVETDLGEVVEMTLEDGRRHLFWGRDFQVLSEWAAEQKPVACVSSAPADPSLMNTGITLNTNIPPAVVTG
jgi:hypothetical protein